MTTQKYHLTSLEEGIHFDRNKYKYGPFYIRLWIFIHSYACYFFADNVAIWFLSIFTLKIKLLGIKTSLLILKKNRRYLDEREDLIVYK